LFQATVACRFSTSMAPLDTLGRKPLKKKKKKAAAEASAETLDNTAAGSARVLEAAEVKKKKKKKVSTKPSEEVPAAAASSSVADAEEAPLPKPDAEKEHTFESLGLCPELCEAVKLMKWDKPTGIQCEALPWAFQGRDIIGLAETGSGKTAAFALPIVQQLLNDPQRFFALALAPTRELCVQIGEQFEAIGSGIKLQTATIVGGLDMVSQAMALAKRPHVVVATPGRLVDHLENTKGFHLKTIRYLVMDEADRLLSMDFDDALDKILESVPRERNTYLFSATMTSKVSKLQRASLRRPVKVEVSTKHDTVKGLVQNFMFVPYKFKNTYFASVMAHFQHYAAMVFCDTCLTAKKLSIFLRHLGYASICLHGQMTQAQRLGALTGFKAKERKILVCTDVASRGLDIPAVDLVVNFDIPKNSKDYIHRVGRTARAGRSGRAISLVTQYDIEIFQRIEHFLGKKLDEFTDLKETTVKAGHERVLEALRSAELEVREEEQELCGKALKRKMKNMGKSASGGKAMNKKRR